MTRPLVWAVALAAVFGAWEIVFADFMADDFMQLAVLERVSPAAAWTSRFDLYNISDGIPEHVRAMQDAGLFAWFAGPRFCGSTTRCSVSIRPAIAWTACCGRSRWPQRSDGYSVAHYRAASARWR